jgi:hypothetical protein
MLEELLASNPSHFTPKRRTPSTHWQGAWVGPSAGLDEKKTSELLTLPGFLKLIYETVSGTIIFQN